MLTDYQQITKALQIIDEHPGQFQTAEELAGQLELAPNELSQLFERWAGTGLESYFQGLDASLIRHWLDDSRSRIETETQQRRPIDLRCWPTSIDAVIHYGFHETPFGLCLLATFEQSVCHLTFFDLEGRATALDDLQRHCSSVDLCCDPRITGPTLARIFPPLGAAEPSDPSESLSLMPKGTSFQLQVWEALLRIPAGCVASYNDLARWVGSPNASRAVGGAVGANPISYLIPCHRVLQSNGTLGGYRWGLDRKRAMLAWESARHPLFEKPPATSTGAS